MLQWDLDAPLSLHSPSEKDSVVLVAAATKERKKKKKRVPTQPVRALVILMKQGTVEFFLDSGTCFEHLHLIAIVFAMVCVPWSKVISYVLNYAESLTKPEQGTYSTIFL